MTIQLTSYESLLLRHACNYYAGDARRSIEDGLLVPEMKRLAQKLLDADLDQFGRIVTPQPCPHHD